MWYSHIAYLGARQSGCSQAIISCVGIVYGVCGYGVVSVAYLKAVWKTMYV